MLGRLNERGFRLLMLLDASVLGTIVLGSMAIRYGSDWPNYPQWLYLVSFAVALATFVASLYFGGMYEREPRLGAPEALPRAARQTLAAGGLLALGNLAGTGLAREWLGFGGARVLPFPTANLVILIVLGAVAVAIDRRVAHGLRTRREGPPKVLLVGPAAAIEVARTHLAADAGRFAVVGAVDDRHADLAQAAGACEATDVLLLDGEWRDQLYPDVLQRLERTGVTVLLRVGARESMLRLERVREVGGLPFVRLHAQTIPRSRARFKRFFDIGMLAVGAPVWLPLVGVIAGYQRIVAGRPLLFWQTRVGAGGRPFEMVKFRTMTVGAEEDGRGARLADRVDARVLPACRWVRAARMDELPQLWNVLRGEMSLVGPRPERPELTHGFLGRIAGYDRRHEIPPGLTGLAQIHGRYHTDAEYKLGYDLQYLVNWSPVLDLEILLRTTWVVLARRL
jgi:lipopolysaccharide/colanic/teichoic acid biosynthesis glycosyltransferase